MADGDNIDSLFLWAGVIVIFLTLSLLPMVSNLTLPFVSLLIAGILLCAIGLYNKGDIFKKVFNKIR